MSTMSKTRPTQGHEALPSCTAHVDGGLHGIGIVLNGLGETIRISKWIGKQDSNVAEYVALLEAEQAALDLNAQKLHVFSDAQVIVRQMTGEYTCSSPRLYSLNFICRKLARLFDFTITHIPREDNCEAHNLAAAAKGMA
jgi:ribonuclease HI